MNKSHLNLDEEDFQILKSILNKYDAKFYAYGSRIKNTNSKFSDIDLCFSGNIDEMQIKSDFEESDLSVKVDIKNIKNISTAFLNLIKHDLIEL
jgi:type I restriction enzyme S subunit